MTTLQKLILDAGFNGRLTGQHTRQAQLDIEAAGILHALTLSVSPDKLPEETVADYFTAIWTNPNLDGYRMAEPLAPSAPEPGIPVGERVRREAVRWFQSIGEGYTPIPLSPDATTAATRLEIRFAQLADAHPVFRESFARVFKLQSQSKEANAAQIPHSP